MTSLCDLRCNDLVDPLTIDAATPHLSWRLATSPEAQGKRLSRWRVRVASSREKLISGALDLWDSGSLPAEPLPGVTYAGRPLASRQTAFWQVCGWDEEERPIAWSPVAQWSRGLVRANDWQAEWISLAPSDRGDSGRAPFLRHEFDLPSMPRRAIIYVCALGCGELYLNGGRVGDQVLDPAQTDYEQRCLYVAYDVTRHLRAGANAIGLILGNGWYQQDRVWPYGWYGDVLGRVQLHVELDDGTEQTVRSTGEWRGATGPILANNLYAGEIYDARRELSGWASPGYSDQDWATVQVISRPGPGGRLTPQNMPPIRCHEELAPVACRAVGQGAWVFDFGQNFAGWARLDVANLPGGTELRLRFAETCHPDGTLDTASTGVFATKVEQVDTYICSGSTAESWMPRFTYHGFRYVELTGYPGPPPLHCLTGIVVHTALPRSGEFHASDPTLERLQRVALWTQRSNLHGLPTDCPARERCGWLGDAHVTAEMVLYNYESAGFWRKYLGDIETTRRGGFPHEIAPGRRRCGQAPDWAVAMILLPWYLYLYRGDHDSLAQHYAGMVVTMEGCRDLAPDWLLAQGYGDWCSPGNVPPTRTPPALTSTALFYTCATIMQRVAKVLDRPGDAARFGEWAAAIRSTFLDTFYDVERHTFGSQTGNVLALAYGLVPAGNEQAVADSLAGQIRDLGYHHDTGILGSRHLYEVLGRWGHGEVALAVLQQTTYPSFNHLFERGATTFWECWGEAELDAQHGPRSLNHPMQGAFSAWFYAGLAGINPDPDQPGFAHVLLRPAWSVPIASVSAWYDAPAGRIVSRWERHPDGLHWHVELPPHTTATAWLPPGTVEGTIECRHTLDALPGGLRLPASDGELVAELSSGTHDLVVSQVMPVLGM